METHDHDSEYEIDFTAKQAKQYRQFLGITHGRSWFYDLWAEAQSSALEQEQALWITEEDNIPCDAVRPE